MKTTSLIALLALALGLLTGCDLFVDAGERIERAEAHIGAGNDRAATVELLNALRSEPNNVRARIMLAEVSLRLGDVQSAEKEIAAAKASGAEPAQTAEIEARILLAKREGEALLAQLDASALELEEPLLSTFRGQALHGLGRLDEAATVLEKALELNSDSQSIRVELAGVFIDQARPDAAMQQLEHVLRVEPRNARASAMKGMLLLRRGDVQDARAALQAARDNAPGQMELGMYEAVLASLVEANLGARDLAAAKSGYSELQKLAADKPFVRLLAARIAFAEQNYSSAIAEAQAALNAAPGFLQAKLLLSAALLANGNLNQAEAHLSELVQQAPDNLEARKLLAQTHFRLKRPDRAADILEPLSRSGADSPQIDAMLGVAKLEEGDEDAAIALMERSLRADPTNEAVKLDLALAYIRTGQHEAAQNLLRSMDAGEGGPRRDALLIAAAAAESSAEGAAEVERVVAANPKSIAVLNIAATYFARLGSFPRSRTYLSRALEIDPSHTTTLMNMARLELAAGDADAAGKALDKALAASTTDSATRTALAELALRTGRVDEGVRLLEEVRKADRGAAGASLLLAAVYLQQDKRREADGLIQEAANAADDKGAISSAIGQLLMQMGRYDEALPRLREAIQHDASNAEYRMNLARAQQALGNLEAARESIHVAANLRPDWVPPHASLALIDAREGKASEARARVEQLKKAHPKDAAVRALEGDVELSLRSYRSAAQAYANAFALSPSGALAMREYRARQLGKLPDPTAPLTGWLSKHPEDANVRLVLAQDFVERGRTREAIEQYELALDGARPNAMALNNLAWMYFEVRDARAEATAKKAYELASHVPAIADTYGWILVHTGRAEEGLRVLKGAASNPSAEPAIRYHYAAALSEVGDKDGARRELRALFRSGTPTFPEADAARALLAELGG